MERNYEQEIDLLKKEIEAIKNLLMLNQTTQETSIKPTPSLQQDPNIDPNLKEVLHDLEAYCNQNRISGAVTYIGTFGSGGRQSTWISNKVKVDDLFALIEDRLAEKVLACIGNADRLNILLSILKKPMTVAKLVEECGFNSTGQVYHHLKPLIAADLVIEDPQSENRGVYIIQPHRVQGIIMLLAGISDLLDTQFTQGNWTDEV